MNQHRVFRQLPVFVLFISLFSCASGRHIVSEEPPHLDVKEFSSKYEMRGAWLATVVNLDWPSSRNLTADEQKRELIEILDGLRETGINAVFFQVRAEADAFFPSPYEPWSYWLTDKQGSPPHPYYDPLEFIVDEAHKRGMELHVWLNPYRVHRNLGSYEQHETHIMNTRPEWVLTFQNNATTYAMLNPGLQEVRDFIANIVVDIVRRYDIDGIHFDDYFYPYAPPISHEDTTYFNMDRRGFDTIAEWRRDNIRMMVKQVGDSIKTADMLVKYGISPFGIRKNSDAGTSGSEGYHMIYNDPLVWLEEGLVDYITPQLYWNEVHPQAPFEPLLRWWTKAAHQNNRHIYVGLAPYRVQPPHDWSAAQFINQIHLLRGLDRPAEGVVFFRTRNVLGNAKGITDQLRKNIYIRPALVPPMEWKVNLVPQPVDELRYTRLSADLVQLEWRPNAEARRYAIYRFSAQTLSDDIPNMLTVDNLVGIVGEATFSDVLGNPRESNIYAVTAVNRNNEESAPAILTINR